MKIGDLVRCIETDFGIGIIVKKRPFGGFIVCFPNSEITLSDKCVGISRGNLELIA
tara:strand:+ start:455 stop:622 length:168 start_codon:yes stop_codon:yes gene_type:complete